MIITPSTNIFSIGGVGGPFSVTYQIFTLTNSGTNSLTWSLANTSAWLNVSSTGGALAAAGPATNIAVNLNTVASNLAMGTYTATLAFTNLNDSIGQYRQFTLDIIAPPAITLQPTNQAVLDGENATFAVQTGGGVPQYYQWQLDGTNLTDGDGIFGTSTTNLVIDAASVPNVGTYTLIVSNAAGIVVSSNAVLSLIPSAPVITLQPTNETVGENSTAQFSVAAVGTKSIAYQWIFDETNIIAGATNAVLILPDVQFTNAGNYSVALININGSIDSSNAVLTVTPCDPAPSGLVSWWAGESNMVDQISGYNGTSVGNVTYGPGEVGQAFVFDGNGSGVQVANNSPNLQLQNFTIENWIQRASTSTVSYGSGGNGVIMSYASGGYCFFVNSIGQLILSQLGNYNWVGGQYINDTNWHHVGVTVTNGTVTFYLDGVASAPSTYNVTFTFSGGPGIGYRPDNDDNSFYGSIDELSVYDRALSPTEIQDIYLAGSAGKCFTPVAPAITSQPTNQTVYVGQTANFSVSANGTPPLSYQWTFDATNILGATNATLTVPDAQFNNAGNYAVVITNAGGSILSSNAVLTVNPPPPCDPMPSGIVSWWPGESNTVDQVSGYNGITVGNVNYGPGEVGRCFVFDGNGSGIQVTNNPSGLQLQNFTIENWIQRASTSTVSYGSGGVGTIFGYGTGGYYFCMNSLGQLVLSELGDPAFASGPSITDTNWHHIAVTMTNGTVTFYLDGVASAPSTYDVTFSFTGGPGIGYRPDNDDNSFYGSIDEMSVYNRALSTNEIAAIYNAGPSGKCFTPVGPTITSQPANETVYANQSATFSVSAAGTPSLSYQWTFDTTNIPNATNAVLLLTDVQTNNAGIYTVVVSNMVDSVVSSNAVLTVNPPLQCDPLPSGIVSWWAGEDNTIDRISGYNGTTVGNVTYGPGEVGQCFVLDGNGSGVQVTNDSPNLQLQNFTIENWMKRASASVVSYGSGGNGTLFGYGPGGYYFFINAYGQLVFAQLGNYNYVVGQSITDTNWHHVAVTVTNGTVIFYLDGVASAPSTYNVTYTFTGGPGIGYRPDNDDNSFYGSIDELSVYNRALSPTEVQDIYLAGSGGKCFNPTPPEIVTQPTNETVSLGQTAAFSVLTDGTTPFGYQWTFNTTHIVGATNSSLVLNNVQLTNAGNYAVIVTNAFGSILSSNAVLTVNPPPSCDPTPSGIISWWAAEGNANDQISAYNGTLVGNVAYGVGEVGQCFVINGMSSGIQITASSANLHLQNLTIENWVKRASTSIVSYGSGGNGTIFGYAPGGYFFFINSIGQLVFAQLGNSSYVTGQSITDTGWHHIAVTVTNGTVTFYLDGVGSARSTYNVTYTFTGGPAIGLRPDNKDNSFYGSIDELSVYNRALASNEIAAIYHAGNSGKCFSPTPATITSQPTNETVSVGQTAHFSVTAISIFPLNYQWTFGTTNITGATNTSLTVANVQFTNAGSYAVTVGTPYIATNSSNAVLSVNDILSYFTWVPISSPQFVNMPFSATIQAMGTTNEVLTNFIGIVALKSTNGIPVSPSILTNFTQGVWTGNLTIAQPTNNLVLLATNAAGPFGLANAINVFNQPALGYTLSGNDMLMYWPVVPTNFVMETSPDLINWTPLGIPPLQIGDENLESIEMTAGTIQYYRLQLNGN